jgi:hypothetical protein
MKCNKIQGKWCKNKHGASKIIDTFETYQRPPRSKEIGDVQVVKLPVQPQDIWVLSWSIKLQELKPGGQRVVDVDRLEHIRLV